MKRQRRKRRPTLRFRGRLNRRGRAQERWYAEKVKAIALADAEHDTARGATVLVVDGIESPMPTGPFMVTGQRIAIRRAIAHAIASIESDVKALR